LSTERLPRDYYERPPEPRRRKNWKKRIAFILVGLVLMVLVVLTTVVGLLHNHSFRQEVLRVALQKMSDLAGTRVQVRDFALQLSGLSPSLELYDVTVDGAAPYMTPPLLKVDQISVGIRIVSVLTRSWYFRDVRIEHPVVRVFVDEHGSTNIPLGKTNDSQTSVFDLGIRHAQISRGEVYYNDRQSALDADLHDFEFQSSFDPLRKQYSGRLDYRGGRVQIPDFNPVMHDLQAEFDATPDAITLREAVLTSGQSHFKVNGTIENYSNPRLQANYQALVDSGELRTLTKNSSLPSGLIQLAGSMQFASESNQSFLDTLRVDGNFASGALKLQEPNLEAQDISARYSLIKGTLDIQDLRARALGGRITAALTIRDIAGAMQSQLRTTVNGVQLASIQNLMKAPIQGISVGGTADATIDARWNKSLERLIAKADAKVKGSIRRRAQNAAPAATAQTVPLDGEIHAQYNAVSDQVSFTKSSLRTAQTSVNLSGTVATDSSLQVQFQSKDLSEVETIAGLFRTPMPDQPPQDLGLRGTASFAGTVRGSATNPLIMGQLSADSLSVKGTNWRTFQTALELSPSMVSLRNSDLQPTIRGRLRFDVKAELVNWAFTENSAIELNGNASQLDLADLQKLAAVEVPVTGNLSGKVSVRGSQLNPMGQGAITITQAKISDEPIQSVNLNFEGTGNEVHAKLDVRAAAGAIKADLEYLPKQKAYSGELSASGIRLDQLETLKARNIQLSGVLDLKATGNGTANDPQLQLIAQVPELRVQNQVVSALTLKADVANQVADLVLDSQAVNTQISGRGKVNLSGDYHADITLDTSTIPLQPLIATYLPAQAASITGTTEVHATLKGPLKDTSLVEAHVSIPKLAMDYNKTVQIAAANPIQIDYTKGVLTLQRTTIRGTETELQVQGTIPTDSTNPASLLLLGTVNLRLAQLLDPDITSSGQLRFNIDSYGRRTSPDVQGQIEIVDASLSTADAPVGLQNGNGTLNLRNDRLEIQQFRGNFSGGTLTARGGIVYRPSIRYDLSLAGNGLRLQFPDGVRERLDTNLTITGSTESAVLRGQVNLDQLSFTPDFDFATVASSLSGGSTAPAQSFTRRVQLDVTVQSTNQINLATSKLSLQGAANLAVRGTAAQPVVVGRVNLSGGDLIFRGNRYVIQPSTLDLVNPVRTEPIMNLAAQTTIEQYNIQLLLRGTMDQLRTSYTSDPPLPPADIINLLVFGKTIEASNASSSPGNLGAESVIASTVSGQVTSRIEKIAGISQLSVDPILGSNQQNGAKVTIRQRVTGNLFVTFATDTTSTERQVIKLEYQVSPKMSMSGVRDQNGGFALDIRRRKTW